MTEALAGVEHVVHVSGGLEVAEFYALFGQELGDDRGDHGPGRLSRTEGVEGPYYGYGQDEGAVECQR